MKPGRSAAIWPGVRRCGCVRRSVPHLLVGVALVGSDAVGEARDHHDGHARRGEIHRRLWHGQVRRQLVEAERGGAAALELHMRLAALPPDEGNVVRRGAHAREAGRGVRASSAAGPPAKRLAGVGLHEARVRVVRVKPEDGRGGQHRGRGSLHAHVVLQRRAGSRQRWVVSLSFNMGERPSMHQGSHTCGESLCPQTPGSPRQPSGCCHWLHVARQTRGLSVSRVWGSLHAWPYRG